MKVEAIAPFFDLVAHADRKRGDVWEADAKRIEEINNAGFGELVKAIGAPVKKSQAEQPIKATVKTTAKAPVKKATKKD